MTKNPTQKYNSKIQGFTLLEVIISLAIFAILSIMSFALMQQLIDSDSFLEEESIRLNELSEAFAVMESDFSAMIERPYHPDLLGENLTLFEYETSRDKTQDKIAFIRSGWLNPNYVLQRSSLQRVNYKVENDILYREYFTMIDPLPGSKLKKRQLLTKVKGFSIRFLKENEWLENWDDQLSLPIAFEVIVRTEKEGEMKRIYKISNRHYLNND